MAKSTTRVWWSKGAHVWLDGTWFKRNDRPGWFAVTAFLRPTRRRNPVVSISLRKIYQVEPRFWSTLTFSRLSLSDGSCSAFLRPHGPSCTVIALDVYPKRYWWPLIQSCASKSCRLAVKGVVWGTSVTFQTRLDSPSWDPWGSLGFWCTILGYIL